MKLRLITLYILSLLYLMGYSQPRFGLRLLNHWDNPDGTVERGYAGNSIWKWDEIPSDGKSIPQKLQKRYEEYARYNAQIGINGTVVNNVNAKPMMLRTDMLHKVAKVADVLRPYGIKVYLAVNFASPKALGDCETADPLDTSVQQWWQQKTEEIYQLVPDFGGFLVKANSEGEPGPMDYGRTHVDGANMLARVLKPHGGIVMWRAFVYSAKGGDRASQAVEEFLPYDGQFMDNVIIQIKNGPIDFQPREPVSPLFYALKKTKMMAELQITQEYTGHSIHTCYQGTLFQEFLDAVKDIPLYGIAGVANIGDAENWCGNDLARANWYAFGRMTGEGITAQEAAHDFLTQEYTTDAGFVKPMTKMLMQSRETVISYMMPLGLHHLFAGGHHYGPEPWCAPAGWREDWLPRYYHQADSVGLGFDRTESGSNHVSQYPEPIRSQYANLSTCPENLMLWFHHVPWDYRMHNGLTLWDNLCYSYDQGVKEAHDFLETWRKMRPYVNRKRYERQLERFERQAMDAQWWRDACLLYFQQFSKRPFPSQSPKAQYTLEEVQNYHLDINNYTTPKMEALPTPQTLRLPAFLSDGMVLQRGKKVPVWGWAKAGERIQITFGKYSVATQVAKNGTWKVTLPAMKACQQSQELQIEAQKSGQQFTVHDVLVGDVFFCSGQSNMELPLRRCMDVVSKDVEGYQNKQIRYYKVPHQFNCLEPDDDLRLPGKGWTDISNLEVSAICHFMARELQEEYHVPIGIINSAVGGTRVESWMPKEALEIPDTEWIQERYQQTWWTDSVSTAENAVANAWEQASLQQDTIVNRWKEKDYDPCQWPITSLFGDWWRGNGSYWFYQTFNLADGVSTEGAQIRLGAMKDADSVYVNGQLIGTTSYQYPPRIYRIPSNILQPGKNEVMIHLNSQLGVGEFTPGKLYQVELGKQVVPLDSMWYIRQGSHQPEKPASTYLVDGNTGLYNAMVAPFRDFPIRGVVWYQGESNLENANEYGKRLCTMISSWRENMGKDCPFVVMQLPGYMERHEGPYESSWTQIREQQRWAVEHTPKSGLASLLDTGEWNDIHPQDKKTAGHRAALQMMRLCYGKKGIAEGPKPVKTVYKNGEIEISFSTKTGKLKATGPIKVTLLSPSGAKTVTARITGNHSLRITAPEGCTQVRYGWDDFPKATLYNSEGLPAPQWVTSPGPSSRRGEGDGRY